MPRLISFEETPNPDAVKCLLDAPASASMRSFYSPEDADDEPTASALMRIAGVRHVLLSTGAWLTVCKQSDASWKTIKPRIRKVLGG